MGMTKMVWPVQSRDLNPIENIWNMCKDQVQSVSKPKNRDEMWKVVELKWQGLLQEVLKELVETMPCRIEAVLSARGVAHSGEIMQEFSPTLQCKCFV